MQNTPFLKLIYKLKDNYHKVIKGVSDHSACSLFILTDFSIPPDFECVIVLIITELTRMKFFVLKDLYKVVLR